jgi:hypothetical protein
MMKPLLRVLAARAAAILLTSLAIGCGSAGADPAPMRGTQYIVGIDISGSRSPTQLAEARTLLVDLIGRLENGDRLVLVETYQGGRDAARQWDDSIPPLRVDGRPRAVDRKHLERFRSSATMIANTFFDANRSETIMTTDLLTTVQRAADYATAGNGRPTVLLLLSDMLNATRDLNMERAGGIPDSAWVAKRMAAGLLPDLHGVCVFAVGADVGSAQGVRARTFWRQYFHTAGATFDNRNYRRMISDAGEIRCRNAAERRS